MSAWLTAVIWLSAAQKGSAARRRSVLQRGRSRCREEHATRNQSPKEARQTKMSQVLLSDKACASTMKSRVSPRMHHEDKIEERPCQVLTSKKCVHLFNQVSSGVFVHIHTKHAWSSEVAEWLRKVVRSAYVCAKQSKQSGPSPRTHHACMKRSFSTWPCESVRRVRACNQVEAISMFTWCSNVYMDWMQVLNSARWWEYARNARTCTIKLWLSWGNVRVHPEQKLSYGFIEWSCAENKMRTCAQSSRWIIDAYTKDMKQNRMTESCPIACLCTELFHVTCV